MWTGWRIYGKSLYYVCSFSISLKLFQNKKFLKRRKLLRVFCEEQDILWCHCSFAEYGTVNRRGQVGANSPHDRANTVSRVLEVTTVWIDISWQLLGTPALPKLCTVLVTPQSAPGSGGLSSLHPWPLVWQPSVQLLHHIPSLESGTTWPLAPQDWVHPSAELSPGLEGRNISCSLQIRGSLARKP